MDKNIITIPGISGLARLRACGGWASKYMTLRKKLSIEILSMDFPCPKYSESTTIFNEFILNEWKGPSQI